MSITDVYTISPNEWTLVAPLSRILNLHSDAQDAICVCFGSSTRPAAYADYIVMMNHLPRAVIEPYRQDPLIWIRPDGENDVQVTVTLSDDEHPALRLDPAFGPLAAGKVGEVYSGQQIMLENDDDTYVLGLTFVLNVTEGSLPPGLSFARNDYPNTFVLVGTPTEAGTYFFTLAASLDPAFAELYDLTYAPQGRFSIEIAA